MTITMKHHVASFVEEENHSMIPTLVRGIPPMFAVEMFVAVVDRWLLR